MVNPNNTITIYTADGKVYENIDYDSVPVKHHQSCWQLFGSNIHRIDGPAWFEYGEGYFFYQGHHISVEELVKLENMSDELASALILKYG